jgi:hypothetical protein
MKSIHRSAEVRLSARAANQLDQRFGEVGEVAERLVFGRLGFAVATPQQKGT